MKRGFTCLVAVVLGATCLAPAAEQRRPATTRAGDTMTFANAITFFQNSLRHQPVRVNKRCAVFYEGEWESGNIYRHSVIVVENADEDVEITVMTTDDSGVQWLREFIDSPMFEARETEQLFQLLQRGPGTHRAKVGRYRVEVDHWKPKHHLIIVFSFTPNARASR